MSILLTANFVAQTNSVLPLAQSVTQNGLAVRVASLASNTIGTLTASNAQSTELTWTLVQAPSWVSLSLDPTTFIATLAFSNAQPQINPYQFYIEVTDGLTTTFYPVFMEVKDPLYLAAVGGGTNFNIQSYDSTVSDIQFKGYGLNGAIDTGVNFVLPAVVPGGLEFATTDGSGMSLRIPEPSANSVSGGINLYTTSPVSTNVLLGCFKEGTFYDSPSRAFMQDFTIDSLTAKAGIFDGQITVFYNTSTNAFEVDSYIDFLEGQTPAYTYQWTFTGSSGIITSGGGVNDHGLVWTPTATGTVSFKLNILNASSTVIGTIITTTFNCAVVGSWVGTPAIKISTNISEPRGYAGAVVTFPVSVELAANETVTVTLATFPGSVEIALHTLSPLVFANSGSATTMTLPVSVTLPASTFNEKWLIQGNATNGSGRTGAIQVVVASNGLPQIGITLAGGNTINSNIGTPITPIAVSTTPTGATLTLIGAPAGIYLSGNAINGNAFIPGSYTFLISADYTGYARSYTSTITLIAVAQATPLQISGAVPSVTSVPDNTQFEVTWGYSGTPLTMNLAQGFNVRSVLGSTSAALTEVGPSVITIYGTSFFGDAYSVPAIVVSSSVTAAGDLLDSPTIGTIDQNYNLVLDWNPYLVDGSYQAYKAWNIWLTKLPNGTKTLQTINGLLPTGLEPAGSSPSSRIYDTVLSAGDWQITMQALTADTSVAFNSDGWDFPHNFPTDPASITGALVTLDNTTVDLNQPVTFTLNPNYIGADTWQLTFADGTSTGWLPISNRSYTKTFAVPGNLAVIAQTQKDYSTFDPPVKLRRQYTTSVYVMNQQYSTGINNTLTGNLGIGGTAGFEITDASNAAVPLAPYEVIVRALVRDTVTSELKLMVATSRTSNASSLLGTMATDVFPIKGRPHDLKLINLPLYLTPEATTVGNPVSIATNVLPIIVVGKPMTDFLMQTTANTGVAPFSWYAEGLPFGIKLSTNGTLSGTATAVVATNVDFSVVDSNNPPFIAHAVLALTVQSDLAIPVQSLPNGVVTIPYNQQIVFTGGIPPYTWSIVSGAPPIGVTVDPVTGILEGTPCSYNSNTDFSLTYNFVVQVVDSIGAIASRALSMGLAAAPLSLGPVDQTEVFIAESSELTIPIYGGVSPYALVSLTDDGVIGNGLSLVNPDAIALVAGVEPPSLTITTPLTQEFYPQHYPYDPGILLTASGGQAPYTWTVVPGLNTTLPSAAISNSLITCEIVADGSFLVTVKCTDSLGNYTQATISVTSQQKDAGVYSIKPVSINQNGSTNPANWIIAILTGLPDAKLNSPYQGSDTQHLYGLALYQNNVFHPTQNAGGSGPMNFSVRSGALPSNIVVTSANAAPYTPATDYSGLILINTVGGSNPNMLGPFSFEAEFSNIETLGGSITQDVSRQSITVTNTGSTPPTLPTAVIVVTTGQPLSLVPDGSVDSHYTLTGVPSGSPLTVPGPVYANAQISGHLANTSTYKWDSPYTLGSVNALSGVYTYTTSFDLTGTIPSTASLSGTVVADDSATILLNGNIMVSGTGDNTPANFAATSNMFVAGVNTITITINNLGGPTGFQLNMSGTVQSLSGALQAISLYNTGVSSQAGQYVVDLTKANLSPYPWYLPLNAEGGTAPYTFTLATGSNLPGAAVVSFDGGFALTSTSQTLGAYEVIVVATDTNGIASAQSVLGITLTETPTEPIHIVSSNFPTYVYENRPLPGNTYYVESDLMATFAASNMPAGLTLSTFSGTRAYLTGTPTVTGNFSIVFTATSTVYNTTATVTATILIKPQTAVFINAPTSATIGTAYRVSTNNSIIHVQYTGYQPGDANLPLVTSQNGSVGAPGVTFNGLNTTSVSNLTSDGFIMNFDYVNNTPGNDLVTLNTSPVSTITINAVYPALVATGTTSNVTVSEYSMSATIAAPVTVSGGKAPYSISITGLSDARFTASGSQVMVNIPELEAGQTTSCSVLMTVTDSASNSTTATGTIAVTVRQETYITVTYSNLPWTFSASTQPAVYSIEPNVNGSVVKLGHPPYQYYVDAVNIPSLLLGKITVSPTQRVLAVNISNTPDTAMLADLDQNLNNSSSFSVPSVTNSAFVPGTYTIPVTLRVVDSESLVSSMTVNINLTITT